MEPPESDRFDAEKSLSDVGSHTNMAAMSSKAFSAVFVIRNAIAQSLGTRLALVGSHSASDAAGMTDGILDVRLIKSDKPLQSTA